MMAIRGKQHIDTYVTEPSFTNTRAHHKRAVVSLIKARIVFTNRTKNETPPNKNLPTWMSERRSRVGKPKVCTRDTIQTRTMFLQGSWVDLQGHLRQSLLFLGF